MLTKTQLDARAGKLTSSRVACLMQGDAEKIMRLYREMIGEEQPEDLSDVWPVRLGEATEALNLEWYERKSGDAAVVTRQGEVVVHPQNDWAAATLDGFDAALQCCIECKHVGGREPIETIIERYYPQCSWQMFVTKTQQCALSVIVGANAPVVEYIDRDEDYIAEMVARGRQFMSCVRLRRPPVVIDEPVPPPIADKVVDMSTDNQWAYHAADWLMTREDYELHRRSETTLKSIVPQEAKKAFGAGVRITRDRAGRLSLREDTEGTEQ